MFMAETVTLGGWNTLFEWHLLAITFEPRKHLIYRVIEKDGRDLKPLQLKKYWTDLHVWHLKMFRKV